MTGDASNQGGVGPSFFLVTSALHHISTGAQSQCRERMREDRLTLGSIDASDETSGSSTNLDHHHLALAHADRPECTVRAALDR